MLRWFIWEETKGFLFSLPTLLCCQVLESVRQASELIMTSDFMALHRRTCCHSWWSNPVFAYLADGQDLFLVPGGTWGVILQWLQTRNISSPPAWSQLWISRRWLIEFDTCNKKKDRLMFMILKRVRRHVSGVASQIRAIATAIKKNRATNYFWRNSSGSCTSFFLLFTSVSPPFPLHHPRPPRAEARLSVSQLALLVKRVGLSIFLMD